MIPLSFLSRLAFLCNLCFLATVCMLSMEHPPGGALASLVLVTGVSLAFAANLAANLSYGLHLFFRKPLRHKVPQWLMVTNFLFLVPELILLLK